MFWNITFQHNLESVFNLCLDGARVRHVNIKGPCVTLSKQFGKASEIVFGMESETTIHKWRVLEQKG